MTLGQLLGRFQGMKAVVIGDLMLDEYIFGSAARISPEAPVMVIRQSSTDRLPGGAANVARNLLALGAQVSLVGVVGADTAGTALRDSLQECGLDARHLVEDAERPTTRKTRIVANHSHQVLRVDHETTENLPEGVESALLERARALCSEADVVVLSDYLKGTLSAALVGSILNDRGVKAPVVANPKPRSLTHYRDAALISLNRAEATEALGLEEPLRDMDAIDGAMRLKDSLGAQSILLTLGESGLAAFGNGAVRVEAPKVEVYDTAGAGDTVIATVALGLAAAGFSQPVFELAARTASCVVRHVGVATPSASDLDAIRQSDQSL